MTNLWLLVATREIVVRVMNKAFLGGLFLMVGMLGGMMLLMAVVGNRTDTYDVAVLSDDTAAQAATGAATELLDDPEAGFDMELAVADVANPEAAEAALRDGEADVWLRSGTGGWTLAGWGEPSTGITRLMVAAVREEVVAANAAEVGTTVTALTAGSELETERLDDHTVDPSVVEVTGLVASVLFLFASIFSGTMIATSVIEEKQSRLVEIISTAIPLRQLLVGKVLGNSVIALGQNLVLACVGLIGVSFTEYSAVVPQLSVAVVWFVVFFMVGFVAVAALFAVAGSLASRVEDVNYTTIPLIMILTLTYFVSIAAIDGTFGRAISFVPPMSIYTMPVRIFEGSASWWEPLAALAVLVATTAAAVLVSERAYRGALMQTGGRLSWLTALSGRE